MIADPRVSRALLAEADDIIAAEPRPRLGEVVRDTERLIEQALTVLASTIDRASLPADAEQAMEALDLRNFAAYRLREAAKHLRTITDLGLPPVGSAVQVPARQDSETIAAPVGSLRIATPDGPVSPPVCVEFRRDGELVHIGRDPQAGVIEHRAVDCDEPGLPGDLDDAARPAPGIPRGGPPGYLGPTHGG
ncbi:hypothetical protein [Actinoplanes sp. N902-109]|uniref:hypothetical protein n=1 Tax=Actinoplanes sp. (strain N902-109) TaxID=649831 RepID=UPI0003294F5A|nr:hypothetical protein [Actinoplanes sp. N902-109]AGL19531.1 hypothetical protein L083_6021 [Actinoplanes sp. N902-109]